MFTEYTFLDEQSFNCVVYSAFVLCISLGRHVEDKARWIDKNQVGTVRLKSVWREGE